MTARSVYLRIALFMLRIWFSVAVEDAEIFETIEDPGGIHRQNQTASMSVTYTKPTGFETDWVWLTTSIEYLKTSVVRSNLPTSAKLLVSHTYDGKITETIKIETNLINSGVYKFVIFDPYRHQSVQTINFTLNILAPPSEIKLSRDDGKFSHFQYVNNFDIFDCSVKGYPHPNITWEIKNCTNMKLTGDSGCDDRWKPFELSGDIFQLDSSYERKVVVHVKAKHIGNIRCVAKNTEGLLVSEPLMLIPRKENAKIIQTAYAGGIYRKNQTATMNVTYYKPQTLRTEWELWNEISDTETAFKSKLPKMAKLFVSSSTNGSITETLEVVADPANSGDYVFRVFDPTADETFLMTQFQLRIADAPRKVEIEQRLGRGRNFVLLCSAFGYPLPTLTWEFSECTHDGQLAPDRCNQVWKPILQEDRIQRKESDKFKIEWLGFTTNVLGKVRCVAENTEGKLASEALMLNGHKEEKTKIQAPTEVKLVEIGLDGGGTRRIILGKEKGDNYIFECSAVGYPVPTLTWEFSECNHIAEQLAKQQCKEENWNTIEPVATLQKIETSISIWEQIALRTEILGKIRCVAENTEGRQVSRQSILFPKETGLHGFIYLTTQFASGIEMTPDETTTAYRGDQLNVTCGYPKFMVQQFVIWTKVILNGNDIKLADQYGADSNVYELDKRHLLTYDNSSLKNRYSLTFNNISKSEDGIYRCSSFFRDYYFDKTLNIAVADEFTPAIAGKNAQIQFERFVPLSLPCVATGGPPPSVTWYKDGKIVDATLHYNFTFKLDSLDFVPVGKLDEGEYVCVATNRVGEDRKSFNLTQKVSVTQSDKTATILASIGGPVMLIGTIVIIRMAMINALGRQNLHRLELELRAKQQDDVDPTMLIIDCVDSGTMNPGYLNRVEVDSLIIDRRNPTKLGEGNFGIVLLVKMRKSEGSVEPVALKSPKSTWDVGQYRMLFKAICLMTFLKKHPNIVNMIGYVMNISKGQLYMVMELCTDGSLESRLDWVREDFVQRFCSELRDQNEGFAAVDRYVAEDVPDWPSIKASLKPKGFVFHADLISYAYQVASAMVYLAEIKFVHRDLAARNILLSHNFKVAKIADFGLSDRIYKENYKFKDKQPGLMLPLRWTPPESLMFSEFSSGSDVWSFGVVLGEIFSLGEIPFAHVADRDFIPKKLLSGEVTPSRPDWASNNIFNLILSCCKPERKCRITFAEAKIQLGAEFDRCSPEDHISLLVQLQEIERHLESQDDSATDTAQLAEGPTRCYSQQQLLA